jgi:hypothetical protein
MRDTPSRQLNVTKASLPQSFVEFSELHDPDSPYNEAGRSGKEHGATYFTILEDGSHAIAMAQDSLPESPWVLLTGFQTTDGLGLSSVPASVFADSFDTMNISADNLNPSFLTGLVIEHCDGISMADPITGAIVNDTGRTITMTGSISYNPKKSSGTTVQLNIVSERSDDGGITWFGNLNSRRSLEVSNNGESFGTKVSLIIDWLPDQLLRFRMWTTTGLLDFESTSKIGVRGEVFTAPSCVWELAEI